MSTEQQEKRALLISELATRIFVSSRTICVKDAVDRAKAIVDYSWELTRVGPVVSKETDVNPNFYEKHVCVSCSCLSEPHTLIETWEGAKMAWCSQGCLDRYKMLYNGLPNYKSLTSQAKRVG